MFNALELLKFQVTEELEKFSVNSPVLIFMNEESGQYVDHFVEGDYSRTPPNIIQQMAYGVQLFKCTLGDLHQAVVGECERRHI